MKMSASRSKYCKGPQGKERKGGSKPSRLKKEGGHEEEKFRGAGRA